MLLSAWVSSGWTVPVPQGRGHPEGQSWLSGCHEASSLQSSLERAPKGVSRNVYAQDSVAPPKPSGCEEESPRDVREVDRAC